MTHKTFDHQKIEANWQRKWLEDSLFTPDIKNPDKKFYNLMMFPYPSAEGLHVGSMYAFSGADIFARYKRMCGYDVFEPIGLDGFGIHSENYAIKTGEHPKKQAIKTEKNYYRQLTEIGNSYAWGHRLETYDPKYYRWTQWLFIKLFEAGLAYRDETYVNWCPHDKTVLADEQVEDGHCERCGSEVLRKKMSGWFLKITEYADRLLNNLDKLDWPEKIKIAQRQWIGKKSGINITYSIKDSQSSITVFTTRPETNFGATFIVVAPEYAQNNLSELVPEKYKKRVESYIKKSLKKTEQERKIQEKEKTGVFSGLYAVNPLNKKAMPVYVADYVLMSVGTGAVVGVPAHDKRDLEFAKRHELEVVKVVSAEDDPFAEDGVMINSDFLNGLDTKLAKRKITDYLQKKGWGKKVVTYHLRDWGISRQRYWGPPIPMINCPKCGWVPESLENLPVVLPFIKDFKPKGDGTTPLANAPVSWRVTKCPKCLQEAERELEVSDTFLDSSWYFLAYPNLKTDSWENGPTPFDAKVTKKWLPVDTYIGGAEHAVLHLLYARFIWMFLYDQDLIDKSLGDEPFPFLYGHGLIIKDGAKMSKSKGNVINPDDYIKKYGADTLRLYLMFLGPFDGGGDFRDSGIEGMRRFLDRFWKLVNTEDINIYKKDIKDIKVKLHKTIKKAGEDYQSFKFNTVISSFMELVNLVNEKMNETKNKNLEIVSDESVRDIFEHMLKILAPLAPHICEEVWVEKLGKEYSIHKAKWPEYDEKLVTDDFVQIAVQISGKLRATITVPKDKSLNEDEVATLAMQEENILKWVKDKKIKRRVFVPGKVINFVL